MKILFTLFLFLAVVRITASCRPPKQLQGILLDALANKKNQPDAKVDFLDVGIRYYSDSTLQKVRLDETVARTRITIIQDYKQVLTGFDLILI